MIGNEARRSDSSAPWAPFLIVWIPEIFSLFAGGMVQFALVWRLAESRETASLVPLGAALSLLPRAFFNPFIGAVVDRYSRRLVMAAARSAVAVCSVLLLILLLTGKLAARHVLLAVLARATADTFHGKALLATTSLMVRPDRLTRVAAASQAIFGAIMFVTPAAGALLLKLGSFWAILALDASLSLLATAPLAVVAIPRPVPDSAEGGGALGILARDCVEGFVYLKRWPGALGMLGISAAVNFIMQPYFLLLALFAKNELGGGSIEFGLLAAAVGLGFVSGGLALSLWQGFRRKMATSLAGILGAGVFVFISGLVPGHGPAPYVLFFCAAATMPFCMGPIQALVQFSAKADIQGRLFSIMETLSTATAPAALVLAGSVAESAGLRYWYLYGGIAAAAVAVFGFLSPRIRDLGST